MTEYTMSDEDKAAMDDAFDSIHRYNNECRRKNERLMKAVTSVMGQGFYDEIVYYSKNVK